jgi:hypothetical protein
MNKAAIVMALAEGPPVEYRAVATTAAAATVVSKPSGLEVGDLVTVWALGVGGGTTLTTSGGSAWTLAHDSSTGQSVITNRMILYTKVMTALDISAAWNLSAAVDEGALALRYTGHGATTVTMKSTQGGGGTVNISLTLTGFTKAAGHYGAIVLAITNDTTAVPAFTSGLTVRSDGIFNSNARVAAADQQYGYVDGASVIVSNLNPSAPTNHQAYAILLEITGS